MFESIILTFRINLVLQVTVAVPAMTEDVKDALIKNIRRRMTPQPLKIRADIELKCFQFDGVLHIKVSILSPYPSNMQTKLGDPFLLLSDAYPLWTLTENILVVLVNFSLLVQGRGCYSCTLMLERD